MNNQNYDELLESSQTDSDLKQLVSDIDYFLDFEQPYKFNDENDFYSYLSQKHDMVNDETVLEVSKNGVKIINDKYSLYVYNKEFYTCVYDDENMIKGDVIADMDGFTWLERALDNFNDNDFNASEYLQHFENIKKAQNIKITKNTDKEIAQEYLDQIKEIY
ncbi:hypothetical protein SKB0120_25100 (plasmid) [Moraxella osloensis]|jgi:hypothetical protein